MKTEVYSWRVSTELKTRLERAAKQRRISLASILDSAAQEWLQNTSPNEDDGEKQQRLQEAVSKCIGTIDGGNPLRSETASRTIRENLRRRHGR